MKISDFLLAMELAFSPTISKLYIDEELAPKTEEDFISLFLAIMEPECRTDYSRSSIVHSCAYFLTALVSHPNFPLGNPTLLPILKNISIVCGPQTSKEKDNDFWKHYNYELLFDLAAEIAAHEQIPLLVLAASSQEELDVWKTFTYRNTLHTMGKLLRYSGKCGKDLDNEVLEKFTLDHLRNVSAWLNPPISIEYDYIWGYSKEADYIKLLHCVLNNHQDS